MAKITIDKPKEKFKPISVNLLIETGEELKGFKNLAKAFDMEDEISLYEHSSPSNTCYFADDVLAKLAREISAY